jgi:hypothetical protein
MFTASDLRLLLFFLSFIAKTLCTACSATSYKTVPLTNLNKYLHNDTSEIEVNINTGRHKKKQELLKNSTKIHFYGESTLLTVPSDP